MTSVNEGTGNPNAKQLQRSPEAASSGRRIAPAPPGQLSYMAQRCGVTRNDGVVCLNFPVAGYEYCLGHLKGRV
jgi:hypothetical protein